MDQMKWHLDVKPEFKSAFSKIEHHHHIFSAGSCFSEHIGLRMSRLGWQIVSNPFGILFNPLSIRKMLNRHLQGRSYHADELIYDKGLWLSTDHHTSFSGTDKSEVVDTINMKLEEGRAALKKAGTVILTFGTAFYYNLKDSGQVAGNCHKLPADNFTRHLASINETVTGYKALIENIKQFNPDVQIILTVSPVRHWKDGAADNQYSKSILHCAVRELVQEFEYVHYFPSYEILMDELRDYRFYAEDMLHPSDQAVSVIWERFLHSCMSETARKTASEIDNLASRLSHRPMHADTEAYRIFKLETEKLHSELKSKFPYLKLDTL